MLVYVIYILNNEGQKLYMCGTGESGKYVLGNTLKGAAGWVDESEAISMCKLFGVNFRHESIPEPTKPLTRVSKEIFDETERDMNT